MEPGARHASLKEIAELHLRFVTVNSVPNALLEAHERDIAKRVIGTDLAFVLPSLRAARAAAASSILARVHRTQILAAGSAGGLMLAMLVYAVRPPAEVACTR